MDVYEAIAARRSVRQFRREPIDQAVLERVFRAASLAPSARNEQPWQFVILRERRILDAIPEIHPYSRMLTQAPLGILICGDLSLEVYKDFWVQDCSAATQNMLLAAHSLGLGAVWLGIYPMEERVTGIRKMLSLPDHVVPLAIVSVGWPAEEKPPASRYKSERVHYNGW